MITTEKIDIYNRYKGDIDAFARSGLIHEKMLINDSEWYFIESLLSDLKLISNDLTSKDYKDQVIFKLKQEFDSEATINNLMKLI